MNEKTKDCWNAFVKAMQADLKEIYKREDDFLNVTTMGYINSALTARAEFAQHLNRLLKRCDVMDRRSQKK